MARLYPNHPYGRRARGTTATVERLVRSELVDFHRSWFTPENAILVVVGDVAPQDVVVAASRELDAWTSVRASERSMPFAVRSSTRELAVVPMMNKAQADVAYGFAIDRFRVSKRIPAGGSVTFEFRVDQAGVAEFYSNLTNDPRHGAMRGQLVVRGK